MSCSPRNATLQDLPELMRLEGLGFTSDHLSRRSLRRLIQVQSALCLVVEGHDAGALLGYGLWLFRSGSSQARLYSLVVDARSQGQGVGRSLLHAGESASRQRGCDRIRLEVNVANNTAIGLYRRLGFAEAGLRPGYYEDGSDALRMVKELV